MLLRPTHSLFLSLLLLAQLARASEIHVSLFGQPCVLRGPIAESALTAIHGISPEQVYPPDLDNDLKRVTPKNIHASLDRLRKADAQIPSALDRYRELVGKRLDEMLPFFEGMDSLRKTGNADALISGTKKFLADSAAASSFATTARQLQAKPDAAEERLFEIYEPAIEPDPQEEFHRAIRRINVSYVCNYE